MGTVARTTSWQLNQWPNGSPNHGFACRCNCAREMIAAMTPKHRTAANGGTFDDVSKAIIEQLQQDGRRPYATIAQTVGLSEAAVRQRVQRPLKSGAIRIVALTDPIERRFPRQAMIGIRVDGDIESAAEQIEKFPEVGYVAVTAGSFDLLVETACDDEDHLLELLNDRIRAIPSVRSTEAFVYLKLRKLTKARESL